MAVSFVTRMGSIMLLQVDFLWYFFPPFVGTQTKFSPVSSWSGIVTELPLEEPAEFCGVLLSEVSEVVPVLEEAGFIEVLAGFCVDVLDDVKVSVVSVFDD